MAEPVAVTPPPLDSRKALYERLENAPREHAEALLLGYQILGSLYDRGILEIVRGVLASGDKVLQIIVDAANSAAVIRGIRNLVILAKLADGIRPDLLENLARAVPEALTETSKPGPPSLVQLVAAAGSRDTRRALGVLLAVVQSLGRSL